MHYILEVPKDKMSEVADMLRYDGCFEVEETAASYKVHTTRYTIDRWRSFGYLPKVLLSFKTRKAEEYRDEERAIGFTEGVRFAQKVLGGYLIQSK